jgi:heparan-alpha-glucosaminide N-acetyltransferase
MSIDNYRQSSELMNELLIDGSAADAAGHDADLDDGSGDGGGGMGGGVGGSVGGGGGAAGVVKSPSKHPRLVSLDMVRGLTTGVMILVDEIGGVYPKLNHSPWNNITFADFVMPWFLFMVGTSMAFSQRRYLKTGNDGRRIAKLQWEGTRKVVVRALKLYLLGVVLQGGDWIDSGEDNPNHADWTYGWNLATMRFCSILARIAWAYLVAGLAELWLPVVECADADGRLGLRGMRHRQLCGSPHVLVFVREAWKWLLGLSSLVLYLLLTYLTYVPDWMSLYGANSTNVTIPCNVSGQFNTPECSAAGFWDRAILGQAHLGSWMSTRMEQCSVNSPADGPLPADAPQWCTAYMYDPEGILATVPTVLTTLLGVHFGRVLKARSFVAFARLLVR